MSIIGRIRTALRTSRETREAEAVLLAADNVETCLAVLTRVSRDVADRLADRHHVETGATAYETATRLVAQRWPGTWVAREVAEQERRYQSMLSQFQLTRPVRF